MHIIHSAYSRSTRENIIGWDIWTGSLLQGSATNLDHLTIGAETFQLANYSAIQNYSGDTTIRNSMLTGISVGSAVGQVNSDHNYFYGNKSNYSNTSAGSHDVTNVNPRTNSLLYLPRIESGSPLSGQASDGGDVGATVMKRIGVSGTLWGESGYATTTTENLWPFPNENIIKANFASYSNPNVAGARGFATGKSKDGSTQTLTKYIWEYLGNTIPTEIYGNQSPELGETNSIPTILNIREINP